MSEIQKWPKLFMNIVNAITKVTMSTHMAPNGGSGSFFGGVLALAGFLFMRVSL